MSRHTPLFVWAVAAALTLLCLAGSATAQECAHFCFEGETQAGTGSETLCIGEPEPCMMAYFVNVTLCDGGSIVARQLRGVRYSIGSTVLVDENDVDNLVLYFNTACSSTVFTVSVEDDDGVITQQRWSLAPYGNCAGLYDNIDSYTHTTNGMISITTNTDAYGQVLGQQAPDNSIAKDYAACSGVTLSASATISNTPSTSLSATTTRTPTPTPTETPTRTAHVTVTPSETPSISESSSQTPSVSLTSTVSLSASPTETPTQTPSETPTNSFSATRTAHVTVTPSETSTVSASASATPSLSESSTITASASPTSSPTQTATGTPTISETPSQTPSISVSATGTPTISASSSATPTISNSATISVTPTVSASATPSTSLSGTPSTSRSATPSTSQSATPSTSQSATPSTSRSVTPSVTTSATPSQLATSTPTPYRAPDDSMDSASSRTTRIVMYVLLGGVLGGVVLALAAFIGMQAMRNRAPLFVAHELRIDTNQYHPVVEVRGQQQQPSQQHRLLDL